ncbi:MAG: hypothetical protein A3I72_10540 [Candidatus Tectomicrobia bacterium RIFCSPLOWO2_02_FULL_70_19]|nr:MAG: hypothetical protein A3I72_10540 [Candidatus Tectomicrobia bacterium RIFCSPLOWO2_02_FULL_70_19]
MASNGRVKIQARGIQKTFNPGEDGEVRAIDRLDLEVYEGEFVALLGPSGCGKSTFLYMVAGFAHPTQGELLLDGKLITGPGPDRGIVFQEYVLFPWRTARQNIEFGLEIAGVPPDARARRFKELIELIGLKGFEDAYPQTLSGGMQQRVAIARALAYDPDVLLMDEPFGALDAQTRRRMHRDLVHVEEATHKTVLFVTHSVVEALTLSDRVFLFSARPSVIKETIEVDIPRPRDVTGARFVELERHLIDSLDAEVEKMMSISPE